MARSGRLIGLRSDTPIDLRSRERTVRRIVQPRVRIIYVWTDGLVELSDSVPRTVSWAREMDG